MTRKRKLTKKEVKRLLEEGRKLGVEIQKRFDKLYNVPSELRNMVLR